MRIIFSPKYEGLFKATLELIFYHPQLSVYFVVRRALQGIAGSLEDHKHSESLGQVDNLGTIKSRATRPQRTVLHLSSNRRRRSRYLPDYELPPIVQEALDKSSDMQSYDGNAPGLISALRPESLDINTYAHYFNALLAVEDGHQQYVLYSFPSFGSNIWAGGMLNANLPMRLTSKGATISTGELLFLDPTCAFWFIETGQH